MSQVALAQQAIFAGGKNSPSLRAASDGLVKERNAIKQTTKVAGTGPKQVSIQKNIPYKNA